MWFQRVLLIFVIFLVAIQFSCSLTTTESSTVVSSEKSETAPEGLTSVVKDTITSTTSSTDIPSSSTTVPVESTSTVASTTASKPSSSPKSTTTSTTTTTKSTTTSTTTTAQPQYSTEWQDIEEGESEKLVNFVVSEIQKLKVEHKELDDCQELDLSSVLSGKKLNGKTVKYSITLKVQPQMKNTEECLQQNSTMNNMHPEICEADVTEGDRGGTNDRTLLRSTCLQVEELQD